MRIYGWVAILGASGLLIGSALAVLGANKTVKPDKVGAAVEKEAGPALIQEAQVRQPPAAPAAPPAAPSATQRVETTKYDTWVVVCQDAGGTTKRTCLASLRVVSQGENKQQLILNWQIGLNKDGHFVTAFHVPPGLAVRKDNQMVGGGILVQSGLELKFGSGQPRRVNYVSCGPQQCFAEALIDEPFIKDALANTNATVTVHTAGGGPIPFDFSIKGIDKAISLTRK